MKKLALVIALAAGAWLAYRSFRVWPAKVAYEKFAQAWMRGDRVEAGKYGDPEAVRHALEDRALRGMPSGAIMEAFRGSHCRVESTKWSSNGDLEIQATQTIFFDPPGRTTAVGGAMLTHIHHSATLRKTSEGWRVVSFEPEYVDMAELGQYRPPARVLTAIERQRGTERSPGAP